MTASPSRRTTPLPRGWGKLRARILRRDPTCKLAGPRCTTTSTEVDHIDDPDDHNPTNLRGVCHVCHASRTAAQANAARPPRRRPAEPHPGLTP